MRVIKPKSVCNSCASIMSANKIFFISDDEDLSVKQLINKISLAFGAESRSFDVPQKWLNLFGKITGNSEIIKRLTQSLTVDSAKIKLDLNWSPPVQSDKGIEKTVNWYLSNPDWLENIALRKPIQEDHQK